jgi:hypothetical protein
MFHLRVLEQQQCQSQDALRKLTEVHLLVVSPLVNYRGLAQCERLNYLLVRDADLRQLRQQFNFSQ